MNIQECEDGNACVIFIIRQVYFSMYTFVQHFCTSRVHWDNFDKNLFTKYESLSRKSFFKRTKKEEKHPETVDVESLFSNEESLKIIS